MLFTSGATHAIPTLTHSSMQGYVNTRFPDFKRRMGKERYNNQRFAYNSVPAPRLLAVTSHRTNCVQHFCRPVCYDPTLFVSSILKRSPLHGVDVLLEALKTPHTTKFGATKGGFAALQGRTGGARHGVGRTTPGFRIMV